MMCHLGPRIVPIHILNFRVGTVGWVARNSGMRKDD